MHETDVLSGFSTATVLYPTNTGILINFTFPVKKKK